MSSLVFVQNGQALTTSEIIATGVGIEHRALVQTLRKYKEDFETFGPLGFQSRGENGKPDYCVFALLNEPQASLLVTYCKNTEIVRKFKVALVKALYDATHRDSLSTATLSTEEQYEIRKAVKNRAKNSTIHYQTIYNALYDYFKVASYKDLTKAQFAPAITFIQTCDVAPQLEQSVPEGSVVLSKDEAEGLRAFVYCWRYLFRPELEAFGAFLRVCHAPKAGRFREAVHDFNMAYFETILDRHGYGVKDLSCYKRLMSH